METRASYLLVGGFVLILVFGLVGFVIWLAKFQFDATFHRYEVRVDGSVTGLTVGSPVRHSGVRTGEVIEIKLDYDNPGQVIITIEVEAATPIRSDTLASLETTGITGGKYVLLSGGSPDKPALKPTPETPRPVIASRPSTLDQVLEGAPELVEAVNLLLAQANALLNPDNRARIGATLDNIATFTDVLASRADQIAVLIDDAAGVMANMRDASASLNELTTNLTEDSQRLSGEATRALGAIESAAGSVKTTVGSAAQEVEGMVEEFRNTAQAMQGVADEARALVAENRPALRDFTANGLYELITLLTEARSLVSGLSRVTTEVERDPARFLFGDQQQGYETNDR